MIDALKDHEIAVRSVLEFAAQHGRVVILTLAQVGWIERSITNFFPGLMEVVQHHNIEFAYAREALAEWQVRAAVLDEMNVGSS